jgi:hypothetical protein
LPENMRGLLRPPEANSRVGLALTGYPLHSGNAYRLWSAAAVPCGRPGRFRAVRAQQRPRHLRASRLRGKTPCSRPPAASNGSPLLLRACRQPRGRRHAAHRFPARPAGNLHWLVRRQGRSCGASSRIARLRFEHRRLAIGIGTTTYGGYLSEVDTQLALFHPPGGIGFAPTCPGPPRTAPAGVPPPASSLLHRAGRTSPSSARSRARPASARSPCRPRRPGDH